jgi:hypothetical protein
MLITFLCLTNNTIKKMKKLQLYTKRILFTSCVLLGISGISNAQFNDDALFVVANAESINAAEYKIDSVLQEMGFTVSIVGQDDVTDANVDGMSLVLISATVSSGTVTTNLAGIREVNVPVICWEPFIYDHLGFSELDGGEFNASEIQIVGEGHQLAAGLANGNVTISTVEKGVSYGIPAGDAVIIAVNPANNEQAVIFGYEEGATMFNGTAPAKRVGTFLLNDVADATMTEDGWKLFIASVKWAMDYVDDVTGIKNPKLENPAVILHDIYPNPLSGTTNIKFSVSNPTHVRLSIWNTLGGKIITLVDEMVFAGDHTIVFDASNVPTGMYFCRLEYDSYSFVKSITLVK